MIMFKKMSFSNKCRTSILTGDEIHEKHRVRRRLRTKQSHDRGPLPEAVQQQLNDIQQAVQNLNAQTTERVGENA